MDISDLSLSNLTGTSTTEMFLPYVKNKEHYIGHCRTNQRMITFTYTWEICNFWDIYHTMLPLDTTSVKSQPFNFRLKCDASKQNLIFFILTEQEYEGVCHIFLKNTEISVCKAMNILSGTKESYLCNIPIILLSKKATEYLPDNILTICFECKWCDNISQRAMCTKVTQFCDKIRINTSDFILDKKSLVTFVIGDEKLYANKNILGEKSAVFQAMFNCEMRESITNEVKITDMEYGILKQLLSYIQFSVLPDLDLGDIKTLSDLLRAADKYEVQDLKLLCELQLIKLIDTENCMELFEIAHIHNTKYLEKYIQEFIEIQSKDICNPQLVKLIKQNSESLLNTTKYTKINIAASCNTKTNSTVIPLTYKKQSETVQTPLRSMRSMRSKMK